MFPTRFVRRQYEGLDGFNRKMRSIILDREAEATGAGMTRSNVGGWHSELDLLKWGHPEIQVLVELIQSIVFEYVGAELNKDPRQFELALHMEAWANVTRKHHYARPHVHPLANFAIVYYVDVGDPSPKGRLSGNLEFLDPRSRVTMLKTPGVDGRDSVALRPRNSMMLCFPAWIYHYVHPYEGERPRISIAANVTVRDLKDKKSQERPSAVIVEDDS